MHVDLSSEQKALQQELRTYFTNLMTPEVKAKIRSSEEAENKEYKALIRQVGRDGWLGIGWPKEYGGKDFTPIENYIFLNEAQSAGCPIPFLTTNTVGPTIRQFGTPKQKDFFLTEDPQGRPALLDRLQRARGGHRSRRLEDPCGARRRRVGHQRTEALHEPRLQR